MLKRKDSKGLDRRDEIVLGLMAVLVPLAALPGFIGL